MVKSSSDLLFTPRRSKRIRKIQIPILISSDQSATEASNFTSIITTDELLLEILVRLPNARSVIQCSTVCKRWNSLISRQFIHKYIQHHNHKPALDPPYTLLVHSLLVPQAKYGCPFHQLFSDESKILHGGKTRDYLGFLPWPCVSIKASFDDLLLVSNSPSFPIPPSYSVCNPVTKQWIVLPETNLRPVYYERCGLLCKKHSDQHKFKFKVVVLSQYCLSKPAFDVTIFCSETGLWSLRTYETPSELALDSYGFENSLAIDGALYFQVYMKTGELRGLVVLDPFERENTSSVQDSCRFIEMPVDFGREWRARQSKLCFGVVCGKLRVSQFLKLNGELEIKVWEFNGQNEWWNLVHEVRLKRELRKRMFVMGLDPNDGDSLFLMRNYSVVKYKINGEEELEKVGQIPNVKLSNNVKDKLGWWLNIFTIVHPSWPTPIPSLPSL